jgi:hypothetical protein
VVVRAFVIACPRVGILTAIVRSRRNREPKYFFGGAPHGWRMHHADPNARVLACWHSELFLGGRPVVRAISLDSIGVVKGAGRNPSNRSARNPVGCLPQRRMAGCRFGSQLRAAGGCVGAETTRQAIKEKSISVGELRPRLLHARECHGLSQKGMATQLETPFSTYERWEMRRYRVPAAVLIAAERLCEPNDRERRRGALRADWSVDGLSLRRSGAGGHTKNHTAAETTKSGETT